MKIKIWLKAFRLPFLTATIIPILLGSAVAWNETEKFCWLNFFITLAGISFLHIGSNLVNDYFDHKTKNDDLNPNPTFFSGGSRVIQEKLLSAREVLSAALIFFGIGIMIGLYLSWKLKSNIILLLGIIGIFCGFFYTAYPLKLSYRGMGELTVGLCFGPFIVLGSYWTQTRNFSLTPLLISIPIGILILLILYINEFLDYNTDKLTNKRTLVVILGKKKAVRIYHLLLGFVYLYVLSLASLKLIPPSTLIVALTLPLALKGYRISKRNIQKLHELIPANMATLNLHLFFGLLLSISFVLDKILKNI